EQNLLYGNRTNGLEMSNDRGAGTSITGSSGNLVRYNAVHDNAQSGLFTNAAPSSNNTFAYNVVWNHPNGECFLANGKAINSTEIPVGTIRRESTCSLRAQPRPPATSP